MKLCIFGNKTTTKELLVELIECEVKVSHLVTLGLDNAKTTKISGQDDGLIEFSNNQGIYVFNPDNYSLKSNRDIEFFQKQKFDLDTQRLQLENQRKMAERQSNQKYFGII